MDGNGCWRNASGRFEKKKIIDYFHASIQRDRDGFFVQQDKGGVIEKVYFEYEDTALFVFQVVLDDPVKLTLNTGKEIELDPESLWIEKDHLYLRVDGERVKFTDRSMMKIASILEGAEGACRIRTRGQSYPIPEID